ncbi:hypothetical protein ACTA71_000120 [Dictyostelium dimigraforme]
MEIPSTLLPGTIIISRIELYEKVFDELKKDPFLIVPAAFSGIKNVAEGTFNKVVDKLHITAEHFVPRADDVELVVSSLIGCIPTVGPIMQGIFLMMASKMKGTQKQEIITHETIGNMIDIEFAKIKKELLDSMDKKVEKLEIENEKKLCEKAFQALKESGIEMLEESLTFLKLRLLSNNAPNKNDQLLGDIRGYFDILRVNIKKLLTIYYQPKIFQNTPNYAFDVMIIYILIMNNLMNHWYQYGYDPMYALGTPADDEDPATHSFREKLHLNIQRFMKTVNESTRNEYKEVEKDLEKMDSINLHDMESLKKIDGESIIKKQSSLNVKNLENIDKIFYSDPFFYPIPSSIVQVNEPTSNTFQTFEIDTSIKKGPRIYRIDAKSLKTIIDRPPPKKNELSLFSDDDDDDDDDDGDDNDERRSPLFDSQPEVSIIPSSKPINLIITGKDLSVSKSFREFVEKLGVNKSTLCKGTFIDKNWSYIAIKLNEHKYIRIRWLFYYNSKEVSEINYSIGNITQKTDEWEAPTIKLSSKEDCFCSLDSSDIFNPNFEKNYDNYKFGFFTTEKIGTKQKEFILKTKIESLTKSRLHFIEIIVSDD